MEIKNISQLRDDLCNVYGQLREGKIDSKDATNLSNVAAKIIKSASVQLEYKKLIKDKSEMDFLK